MRLLFISFIEAYQRILSPDHSRMRACNPSGYCKYYPSCSEYVKHAILKYGSIEGLCKGAQRIIRCHPWSKGGIDFMI